MKRPIDQVKLLFFGLLRSVSALEHQHPPKIIPHHYYFPGRSATAISTTRGGSNSGFLGSSVIGSSTVSRTGTTTTSMTLNGGCGSGGGIGGGIFSIYGSRFGTGGSSRTNSNNAQQQQGDNNDTNRRSFRPPSRVVVSDDINNNNNSNIHYQQQQRQQQQQNIPVASNTQITIRLAKRTDVIGIQQCNLATLPENYNQQFYINHLRTWPELAIVAEAVMCQDQEEYENESSSLGSSSSSNIYSSGSNPRQLAYLSPFSNTNNNHVNNNNNNKPEPMIVAYVIGKVEERTIFMNPEEELQRIQQEQDNGRYYPSAFSKRSQQMPQQQQQPHYTVERYGHVTSLAVLEPYRRLGLAQDLMKQLHHHMKSCYSVTNNGAGGGAVESVGLHVRQSNLAAAALYQKFGYQITQRIANYYQDGEDAYLMTKRLVQYNDYAIQQQQQQQNGGLRAPFSSVFGRFQTQLRSPSWDKNFDCPMELQLPRIIRTGGGEGGTSNDNNTVYSNNNGFRNEQQKQQTQHQQQQGDDFLMDTSSSSSSSTVTSTASPELLTGTM